MVNSAWVRSTVPGLPLLEKKRGHRAFMFAIRQRHATILVVSHVAPLVDDCQAPVFRPGVLLMPRAARASQGGYCYHVLNRGNVRKTVFYKDGDFAAFIKLLTE